MIAGGDNATRVEASAELYDPVNGTFTATGLMTVARSSHRAVLLADGRVLLVGGVGSDGNRLVSAELYNPSTGTFAATGQMLEPFADTATVLKNGRVLITRGFWDGHDMFVRGAELTILLSGVLSEPVTWSISMRVPQPPCCPMDRC